MSSEQGIIKHPRQMVPQESPVFMTKAQRRQKKQSEPTLDQLLVREEMGWGTLTEKEEKKIAQARAQARAPARAPAPAPAPSGSGSSGLPRRTRLTGPSSRRSKKAFRKGWEIENQRRREAGERASAEAEAERKKRAQEDLIRNLPYHITSNPTGFTPPFIMFPDLFMKKRNEQPVVDKEIGDVGDVGGVGSEKEKHLNEIQLFMDILNNMGENHTIRGLYIKIRGIWKLTFYR